MGYIDDEFLRYHSWYDAKYRHSQDSRWPTFKTALNLLYQLPQHRILETGCVRMRDDWGGGMSTVLFGEFVKRYGDYLVTVDNSPVNMALCMELTEDYADHIDYVTDDSISALRTLWRDGDMFDLIYLDSLDCPIEGDATIAQQHQLSELHIALGMTHHDTVILLDDNGFANGGKCRLSNEFLLANGWTCLMQHQQSLWIRR